MSDFDPIDDPLRESIWRALVERSGGVTPVPAGDAFAIVTGRSVRPTALSRRRRRDALPWPRSAEIQDGRRLLVPLHVLVDCLLTKRADAPRRARPARKRGRPSMTAPMQRAGRAAMNKPADLLGDAIRDAATIEAEHAEQCDAFDGAAAAHALLDDCQRWNEYVAFARSLRFGREAEAMVFLAAASPPLTMGRKAKDPIEAWLYAQADAEGHGPHSRHHGAAVVSVPPNDPTDGIPYDIAGGLDHHAAGLKGPRPKAPSPAREAGQGFFVGLGFGAPRDPADDFAPEGV